MKSYNMRQTKLFFMERVEFEKNYLCCSTQKVKYAHLALSSLWDTSKIALSSPYPQILGQRDDNAIYLIRPPNRQSHAAVSHRNPVHFCQPYSENRRLASPVMMFVLSRFLNPSNLPEPLPLTYYTFYYYLPELVMARPISCSPI